MWGWGAGKVTVQPAADGNVYMNWEKVKGAGESV